MKFWCRQVHYMQTGGRSKLLAKEDARPTLRDLRCASVPVQAAHNALSLQA